MMRDLNMIKDATLPDTRIYKFGDYLIFRIEKEIEKELPEFEEFIDKRDFPEVTLREGDKIAACIQKVHTIDGVLACCSAGVLNIFHKLGADKFELVKDYKFMDKLRSICENVIYDAVDEFKKLADFEPFKL